MRRACTAAVALMASLAAQAAQAGVWEHGTHKDKITGAVKATHLLKSDNTIELSFPYAGAQHAYIHVRDGDVMFTVQRGQILHRDGARVNVDGKVTRIGLGESSDHDSTVAFPNLSSASVAGANSIKIEVTFYQNGNHVLEFTSPVPLKESAEWKAERLAAAEAAKRAAAEAAKRADAVRKEAEVERKRLEEKRASNEVAALSTKLTDSLQEACDQPALAIRWAVAGLHAENLTARAGRDSAKTALAPFTQCLAVNESRLPAEVADLRKTDLQREQERQERERQGKALQEKRDAESKAQLDAVEVSDVKAAAPDEITGLLAEFCKDPKLTDRPFAVYKGLAGLKKAGQPAPFLTLFEECLAVNDEEREQPKIWFVVQQIQLMAGLR